MFKELFTEAMEISDAEKIGKKIEKLKTKLKTKFFKDASSSWVSDAETLQYTDEESSLYVTHMYENVMASHGETFYLHIMSLIYANSSAKRILNIGPKDKITWQLARTSIDETSTTVKKSEVSKYKADMKTYAAYLTLINSPKRDVAKVLRIAELYDGDVTKEKMFNVYNKG